MITTVAQGLENYKTEVRKYAAWVAGIRKRFAGLGIPAADITHLLDGPDYNKAVQWNAKLEGMRLALGITKAEDKAIDAECGIPAAA